jgi:hypothetical protein
LSKEVNNRNLEFRMDKQTKNLIVYYDVNKKEWKSETVCDIFVYNFFDFKCLRTYYRHFTQLFLLIKYFQLHSKTFLIKKVIQKYQNPPLICSKNKMYTLAETILNLFKLWTMD